MRPLAGLARNDDLRQSFRHAVRGPPYQVFQLVSAQSPCFRYGHIHVFREPGPNPVCLGQAGAALEYSPASRISFCHQAKRTADPIIFLYEQRAYAQSALVCRARGKVDGLLEQLRVFMQSHTMFHFGAVGNAEGVIPIL